MNLKEIEKRLLAEQDIPYRDFQTKLMPSISPKTVIGVRTPVLRALAKEIARSPSGMEDSARFFSSLPHKHFEENQLHAFLISLLKDFDASVQELNRFLSYVDNWATCDQMRPTSFAKKSNRKALLKCAKDWMKGKCCGKSCKNPYVVRFGIEILMAYFLDEDFKPEYLEWVAKIRSEEYYVNMMIAWFFATAMAKQYKDTVPYVEGKKLAPWVHNKTIQKSIESFRVTDEQKMYLRSLKLTSVD